MIQKIFNLKNNLADLQHGNERFLKFLIFLFICLESDGLPHDEKLETKHINTCLKLLKQLKCWKNVLVKSTSLDSEKSCLYQLLQNAELEKIAKKQIDFEYKISAISFAGFNGI